MRLEGGDENLGSTKRSEDGAAERLHQFQVSSGLTSLSCRQSLQSGGPLLALLAFFRFPDGGPNGGMNLLGDLLGFRGGPFR
jgi:hypothetical protein